MFFTFRQFHQSSDLRLHASIDFSQLTIIIISNTKHDTKRSIPHYLEFEIELLINGNIMQLLCSGVLKNKTQLIE